MTPTTHRVQTMPSRGRRRTAISPTTNDNEPASPWPYRLSMLLTCAIAMVWTLSYAPNPRVLTAIPGLVCFFLLVERPVRLRGALFWTALFGAVATSVGYRWLAQTVQDFGHIPVLPSYLMVAAFGVAGIVHGMLFAVLHRAMIARGRRPHPLVTVCLIVGVEALPIRLFPWMFGHSAVDVPAILQAASWGGVSGASFVLLCLLVPIYEGVVRVFRRSGPPARVRAAVATFLVGCLLYGVGHLQYGWARDDEAAALKAGKALRVGIVQPNVGSKDKREATNGVTNLRGVSVAAYGLGSREAAKAGAELIVWPETAITDAVPIMEPAFNAQRTNGYLSSPLIGYGFLSELGREHGFLVGMYERKQSGKASAGAILDERYNTAALRQPGGQDATWSVYRKVYLIPFGEYLPFGLDPKKYLPQNFTMRPGVTEGAGSEHTKMLVFKGLKLAPFLCYEGILPEHVRTVCSEERPDILVSLTNDSWFGDTWEPHQHLNFTRFRAVEHRAPLVRATNTGISAFVSSTGDIDPGDRLGVFEAGVLVKDVPILERGPTIYVRFGHWFPTVALVFAVLAFFLALRRRPPSPEGPARRD